MCGSTSIEEEDQESSPSSKSSSSRTKELEILKTSSEWMFTGHWYWTLYRMISSRRCWKQWELRSSLLFWECCMELLNTLCLLAIQQKSCGWGWTRTSITNRRRLHSCKVYKSSVVATISPTWGIGVNKGDGRDSVLASIYGGQEKAAGRRWVLDDHFSVLTEGRSRRFFNVHGRAWAFTGSLTL